jgi:transcriptional regulator with XRE-family HTH domain
MSDNKYVTSGQLINQYRTEKNMTINDLAYSMNSINVKKMEKKIDNWEKDKDFPDLNEIYKLAEIFEINPNLLVTLRDRTRKNIYGIKKRKPRNYTWLDNFCEDLFHVFLPAIGGFYLVALVFGFNAPFIGKIQDILHFLFGGLSKI